MKYQSGMLMDQVGRINYEKYNFARQDFQSFLLRKTIFPRDSFEKNSFHYYFVYVLLCVLYVCMHIDTINFGFLFYISYFHNCFVFIYLLSYDV